MQKFVVTLEVTVNTLEPVSSQDIRESLEELNSQWDSGTIEVKTVENLN